MRMAFQLSGQIGKNMFDAVQSLVTYTLSRNSAVATHYHDLATESRQTRDKVRAVLGDDRNALQIVDRMEIAQTRLINLLDLFYDAVQRNDIHAVTLSYLDEHVQSCLEQVVEDSQLLVEETRTRQQVALSDSDAALMSLRWVLAGGTLMLVMASTLISSYFSKAISNRIAISHDNVKRFMHQQPLHPVLRGTDEVAQLDRTFHDMAAVVLETMRKERAIIDNAIAVICTVGKDRRFTAVNKAAPKVWGYQPEELLGVDVLSIIQTEHEIVEQQFAEAFQRNDSSVFENCVRRKEGTKVDVLWSVFWSDLDQTLFCVAHDISARKRTERLIHEREEQVRLMMETMPLGLAVMSQNGVIEYINRTLENMTGADQSLAGTPFAELLSAEYKQGAHHLLQRLLESPSKLLAASIKRQNGADFPAELSLSAFTAAEQKLSTLR